MNGQRIVGLVLIVVGVVLLVIGINASDSFADQVSDMFTGKFTDSTTWYIVGGIGVAVLGVALAALGRGGKSLA